MRWLKHECPARNPAKVADYLAHLAVSGRKASTINRKSAAIRFAHRAAGHPSPTAHEGVSSVMKGIRRTVGTAVRQKAQAMSTAAGEHRLSAIQRVDTH